MSVRRYKCVCIYKRLKDLFVFLTQETKAHLWFHRLLLESIALQKGAPVWQNGVWCLPAVRCSFCDSRCALAWACQAKLAVFASSSPPLPASDRVGAMPAWVCLTSSLPSSSWRISTYLSLAYLSSCGIGRSGERQLKKLCSPARADGESCLRRKLSLGVRGSCMNDIYVVYVPVFRCSDKTSQYPCVGS